MNALMHLNLACRFVLEMAALGGLGFWGFSAVKGAGWQILMGIGLPLLAAGIWGVFASPKALVPLSLLSRLTLEIILFGGAALAIYSARQHSLAVIFLFSVILNRLLMFVWEQ